MRGFRHMSFKARVDREDLGDRVGIGSLTSYLGKSSQLSAKVTDSRQATSR
jgi:hypothetical protein